MSNRWAIAGFVLIGLAGVCRGAGLRVQVDWPGEMSGPVPVHVDVPEGVLAGAPAWEVVGPGEERLPCQEDPAVPGRLWWLATRSPEVRHSQVVMRLKRRPGIRRCSWRALFKLLTE